MSSISRLWRTTSLVKEIFYNGYAAKITYSEGIYSAETCGRKKEFLGPRDAEEWAEKIILLAEHRFKIRIAG